MSERSSRLAVKAAAREFAVWLCRTQGNDCQWNRDCLRRASESLDEAVEALCAEETAELRTEARDYREDNLRLTEANEELTDAWEGSLKRVGDLQQENDRLRDLLRRWCDACAQACAGAEDCYAEAEEMLREEVPS